MSFHAFSWFRRRQKVFMAGLAILCMVLFVLQFGRGDFFERITSYFGSGKGGSADKTEVVKLLGTMRTVGDLRELAYEREFAQALMFRAFDQGQTKAAADIDASLKKLDEPFGRQVQEIQWRQRIRPMMGLSHEMARDEIFRDLRTLLSARNEMHRRDKPAEARALATLTRMLEVESWARSARSDSYFGGGFDTDSLLDYLLWKDQADKLPITLTEADVRSAINKEAMTDIFSGDPIRDREALRDLLKGNYLNVTLEEAYRILGDEFRVRMAHETLTGVQTGVRAFQGTGLAGNETPAAVTPDEFWNYYRDKRTEIRVAMMTIPVQKFIDQVKDEPTEAELKKLYNRYSDDEPTPDREKPAFKEPRRVKIEWVSASSSSDYYQKESARAAVILDGLSRLLGGAEILGSEAVPTAVQVALPVTFDLRLEGEYESYVNGYNNWLDDQTQFGGARPSETGVGRAENAAAAAGLVTAGVVQGHPVMTIALIEGLKTPGTIDLTTRAVTAVAAGFGPTALDAFVVQSALFTRPKATLESVKPYLVERASRRYARDLVFGKFADLRKELEGKTPKDAAAWLAQNATPEKGITQHGIMTEARDQFTIGDDPALAPLKASHARTAMLQGDRARPFAAQFFSDDQLYRPQMEFGDDPIFYWKTANEKAYVPTFEQARPKLVAAWRLQKAQDLARGTAETVAAAVRLRMAEAAEAKAKDPEKPFSVVTILSDEALKLGYTVFEPPANMAKLVPAPSIRAGGEMDYEPYRFPESQIAYPRPDTVDVLLEKLKEPGETTVVRDRPEKNFYVTALVTRDTPTRERFYEIYERSARGTFLRDLLWTRCEREKSEQFVKDLVVQLRKEGGAPLNEKGDYNIDSDLRAKIDRRRDDSES